MNQAFPIVSAIVLSASVAFASLGGGAALSAMAQAAQPDDGEQHKVHLPLVVSGGNKPAPPTATPPALTPTPPPSGRSGGFFASNDWLSYNADTAVDDTGVHMVFYYSDERHANEPRNEAGYYVFCPGSVTTCADPKNWGGLVQFANRVNEMQVQSTADGRPRLLLRRTGSRGNEYEYWSCEQTCANGDNWSGVWITEAAGVDLYSATHPQHSFALDAHGHPFFVYGNGWGNADNNGIWSASCLEEVCSEPGAWKKHQILFGPAYKTLSSDYLSLAFDGDKPRVVARLTLSGLADRVAYLSCDTACDSADNWTTTTLANPNGVMWANWDLALDGNGHPRVALYEPAPIDIHVGGKLYYAACDGACDDTTSWSFTQIASGEGGNVDLAFDSAGRAHMVYDAGQRAVLAELWCGGGCETAAQWQRRILKTTAQLVTEFAPASPLSCDQGLSDRVWMEAIPKIAHDKSGKLVVAYDVVNRATCYYTLANDPTHKVYSKVERIWWAARWDAFDRAQ